MVMTMVIALTACALSTRENLRVDWVMPGEHQIAVSSEGFKAIQPIRVKYTDSWQTEEYALYKDGGRQLEMIYAQAGKGFTVALNYQMPIEAMVSTWNLNSGQSLVWGPLGRVETRLETWFYRPYELSDIHKPCFGFLVEWDVIYEDPHKRPGKVLFGYYCGAEKEALTDDEIRALIREISIRSPDRLSEGPSSAPDAAGNPKTHPVHNAGSDIPSAIETARGHSRSSDTGNPSFPFMFARYYSTGNGRKAH
jgi:hypothetical protein